MHIFDIAQIVRETINALEMYSDEAFELMMGTAGQESHFQYVFQADGGPARSFWQIEPATALDICTNYIHYRPDLAARVVAVCHLPALPTDAETCKKLLTTNLAFAVCLARILYRRVAEPIPYAVEEQAQYWKVHYNTRNGKGTVMDYLKNHARFHPYWR